MTTPYTYLIGWKSLKKYYYGRRTAKNCTPDEFWKTYFTSSPDVKDFVEENGNPDIIQIRKIFNGSASVKNRVALCAKWENRVLRRVRAASNPIFLNKSNGDAKFDVSGMVTAIDIATGTTSQISIDEFTKNPEKYKGILTGKVIVTVLATGETKPVPTEEYHKNKNLYRHNSTGLIHVTVIATGETIRIPTEEFHANRHLYKHHSDGTKLNDFAIERLRKLHQGVSKTEEHKENIAKALKGKKKTPEHVANVQRNRRLPFKAVIVNGIHFPSVNSAAAHFGVRHSAISNRLAGRKKLSAKFWEVRYADKLQTPSIV